MCVVEGEVCSVCLVLRALTEYIQVRYEGSEG